MALLVGEVDCAFGGEGKIVGRNVAGGNFFSSRMVEGVRDDVAECGLGNLKTMIRADFERRDGGDIAEEDSDKPYGREPS